MLSCPTLDQLSVNIWKECCSLFRHDPHRTGSEDKFSIDGLQVDLFPHQALAIFWVFQRYVKFIRKLFIADEMGIGKTLEFIGVWVFHRSVAIAWDKVQTCWNSSNPAGREEHLPANQKEGRVCPTNPFLNLTCPCINGSMSHLIAQQIKQGPVLMLAPGGNVSVWEEECRRRVDTANRRLRLKWHVAYEKSVLSQQTIQDLQCDAEMLEAKKGQNRHLVIASNQSFYNKVIQPALMHRQRSQSTYETNQEA